MKKTVSMRGFAFSMVLTLFVCLFDPAAQALGESVSSGALDEASEEQLLLEEDFPEDFLAGENRFACYRIFNWKSTIYE